MKRKWVALDKATNRVTKAREGVTDEVAQKLGALATLSDKDTKDLKSRKMIAQT